MTSATTPKTVELFGDGLQSEATCTDAAILPGMLLTRTAGGVRPHNVAAGVASTIFAIENSAVGRDIADPYAVGEQVLFKTYTPGSGIYAQLTSNAAAVAVNAPLTSAGNGHLRLAAATEVIVARAREAVDNSANASPRRIRVEIVAPQRA